VQKECIHVRVVPMCVVSGSRMASGLSSSLSPSQDPSAWWLLPGRIAMIYGCYDWELPSKRWAEGFPLPVSRFAALMPRSHARA